MNNAFLYRMPGGIPGDNSRPSVATIESVVLDASNPFPVYGVPGKIVGGKFVPLAEGDEASVIYGMLIRAFPALGSEMTNLMGPRNSVGDVMRRGYTTVKLNAGTSALGGAVYVRVGAASAGKPVGGIEAAADGTNTVVLPGATFMSAADADGNVEIAYNI